MSATTQSGSAEAPIRAANLKIIEQKTLRAAVDLEIPRWHMIIKGCLWHAKGKKEWISLPGRQWTDDAGGKHFVSLFEFTEATVAEQFQAAALRAVHALAERASKPPRLRRRRRQSQPTAKTGPSLPDDSVDDLYAEEVAP